MTFKRVLAILAMALIFPSAISAGRGTYTLVVPSQTITDAAAVTVTIDQWWATSGYLVVTTADEAGTSTLTVTMTSGGISSSLCTMAAITTNAESTLLFGSSAGVAAPVDTVCEFPTVGSTTFTFTVTGTTPGFTVVAELYWLPL
ncbi:MAG: hypothetical protein E4H28_07345 [Gemmatimonadales bacterium]|nr:MAG: hypothetical protein E4H28_07345 [Gemmatimonadales bacterium]